ncbi:MAG TPA: DUF2336 domain-containing protein [Rhizomicrobium sp.]|jgi:hypothetical protein
MSDPRLTSLVELATENAPEKRRSLCIELCDLLLDWPSTYPAQMREPFETLLEKTVRLIDRDTRSQLIARIAVAPGASLDLLNEFFFDATADLRGAILERNAEAPPADARVPVDETALIVSARGNPRDSFGELLAQALDLPPDIAARILHDGSGEALAIAIKGAHLSRAAYSTLAMLSGGALGPEETLARLAVYESVPERGAESLLNFWRGRNAKHALAA